MLHTRPMVGNVSSSGKSALRKVLEGRRRALTPQQVVTKSGEAQTHLAALSFFENARSIALFRSQAFEVSTQILWDLAGTRAVFPRVVPNQRELALYRVNGPDDFIRGTLGLFEPKDTCARVQPDEIDLWVVPGVGFTRGGLRLGRGAGYYDVTLARARPGATRVGLCFDCSLVDDLPTEGFDVPMDLVVTESGVQREAKTQL